MTTNNNKTEVVFLHPRDSREFRAELGPATTGTQAIDGLVKASFIEPPGGQKAYTLKNQKTGATIPLSESVVAAGIQAGDIVAVVETSSGAGF